VSKARDFEKRRSKIKAKREFIQQSEQTAAELQARGFQLSPIFFESDEDRAIQETFRKKGSFLNQLKRFFLIFLGFMVNLIWFVIERGKIEPDKYFLHSRDKSKREYFSELVLHSATFLSISISIGVLINLSLLYDSPELGIYDIKSLMWYPDHILSLSYIYAFSSPLFFNSLVLTIFIPYFIAGVVAGILWEEDAKDVVGPSCLFSLFLFIFLYVGEYILSVRLSIQNPIISWVLSSLYLAFFFTLVVFFFFFSMVGGVIGVLLGILFSYFAFHKQGVKNAYSAYILPTMPIAVKTLFDMVDTSNKYTQKYSSKTILVYLDRTVELSSKKSKSDICPYFIEGRCAYLGYKTSGNRMQICMSDSHNSCRVLAFILQSKKTIKVFDRVRKHG